PACRVVAAEPLFIGSGLCLGVVFEHDIRALRRPPCHITRPEVALPGTGHISGEGTRLVVLANAKRLGEILAVENQIGELDTWMKSATDSRLQRGAIESMRLCGQRQLLQRYGIFQGADFEISVWPVLHMAQLPIREAQELIWEIITQLLVLQWLTCCAPQLGHLGAV